MKRGTLFMYSISVLLLLSVNVFTSPLFALSSNSSANDENINSVNEPALPVLEPAAGEGSDLAPQADSGSGTTTPADTSTVDTSDVGPDSSGAISSSDNGATTPADTITTDTPEAAPDAGVTDTPEAAPDAGVTDTAEAAPDAGVTDTAEAAPDASPLVVTDTGTGEQPVSSKGGGSASASINSSASLPGDNSVGSGTGVGSGVVTAGETNSSSTESPSNDNPTSTNSTSPSGATTAPATNTTSGETRTSSAFHGIDALASNFSTPASGLSTSSGIISDQAIESSSVPNSVTEPVRDNQVISFRDVSDISNSTLTVERFFDKSSYAPGEPATLTVNDSEANLDRKEVNTITVGIGSTTDPNGIVMQLTETGPDTGIFQAKLGFVDTNSTGSSLKTKAGDKVTVYYFASHARLEAVVNGVESPGSAVITDYFLPPNTEVPFDPIGGAAQITMQDVQVSGDTGSMTVTMSYANANLGGQHEDQLLMFYSSDGGENWNDLKADFGVTVTPHPSSKTVTAVIPLSSGLSTSGVFVLGVIGGGSGGCGGMCGSTGGPALGGSGVVLDFLADIIDQSGGGGGTEPPTTTPPPSTDRGNTPSVTASSLDTNVSGANPTGAAGLSSGQLRALNTDGLLAKDNNVTSFSTVSHVTETRDLWVDVQGVGKVLLKFPTPSLPANITVKKILSLDELKKLGLSPNSHKPGSMLLKAGGISYMTVGDVLEVSSTDKLPSFIDLFIPYNDQLVKEVSTNSNPQRTTLHVTNVDLTTSSIRLLHFTGSGWEDITTSVGAYPFKVQGHSNSFGPVVAAVQSTGP